jgi:hypothetical protein
MKEAIMIAALLITAFSGRAQEPEISLYGSRYDFTTAQADSLYQVLEPANIKPSYSIFCDGLTGYRNLILENKITNFRYITLIDFSLSSNTRRLWVIDLDSLRIVHHSLVSHGRNSGGEYAVRFSNTPNSYMSSIGFYLTGDTYYGKHGHSLYLEGVEEGINDNAKKRAIVMHGADYATRSFISRYGRLGRSFGCPALPPAKADQIIDTIKNRSCLFIYYPDNKYLLQSKYIKGA